MKPKAMPSVVWLRVKLLSLHSRIALFRASCKRDIVVFMGREETRKALDSYLRRVSRVPKKNQKPEQDVNQELQLWFKQNGFSCERVESKAVYSVAKGGYSRSETKTGMSDWVGCTPTGLGCFIEAKAPGQTHRLKDHQRIYLIEKIERGAFAACVDSSQCLGNIWRMYCDILHVADRIIFLLDHLPRKPKKRVVDNPGKLFDF